MPQTIETTVYTFNELNDKAKDKARDTERVIMPYSLSKKTANIPQFMLFRVLYPIYLSLLERYSNDL